MNNRNKDKHEEGANVPNEAEDFRLLEFAGLVNGACYFVISGDPGDRHVIAQLLYKSDAVFMLERCRASGYPQLIAPTVWVRDWRENTLTQVEI